MVYFEDRLLLPMSDLLVAGQAAPRRLRIYYPCAHAFVLYHQAVFLVGFGTYWAKLRLFAPMVCRKSVAFAGFKSMQGTPVPEANVFQRLDNELVPFGIDERFEKSDILDLPAVLLLVAAEDCWLHFAIFLLLARFVEPAKVL